MRRGCNSLLLTVTSLKYGDRPMNPNITFETALQILAFVHVASALVLIAAAQISLAAIATLEEINN